MNGYHQYESCIEACLRCASICNHCAASCTQEEDVKMMAGCIQLDTECAAICYAAAQLMSLGSSKVKKVCRLCAEICETCSVECGKHTHMQHCQGCTEACRRCAEECRKMAA